MSSIPKKVVIVGSTGAVGFELLQNIRQFWPDTSIYAPVRQSVETFAHEEGVHRIQGDVSHPSTFDFSEIDALFMCVGTTQKKTPDKEVYKAIDYGIPLAWSQWAKEKQVEKMVVISALGANPKSSVFYNKLKGEMEVAVIQHGTKETYIVRPSLLMGERKEKRVGEELAIAFYKKLGMLIPKKYKGVTYETVALAMMSLAQSGNTEHTIESQDLAALAEKVQR
ncbi:MAG: oxidoreductase [Schleiferiaceae bacterium]